MREKRYAVLIGMNTYRESEDLPFCVKDVEDVTNALISQCRFNTNDIYSITDSETPVKEQIDLAFTKISLNFRKNQDLLFFYFSGHGEYDVNSENSKVLFGDDTELLIDDIYYRYFMKLVPKNRYLIIDACHSGTKVFFKAKTNPKKEIRKLNYNSSEVCLMFATESKNKAIQGGGIENSYFTHFFVEAIYKKSLYDDDGFLTMSAIDNYIKKGVIEKSEFVQIPVSEIMSSGYNVFCFDDDVISDKIIEDKKPIHMSENLNITENSNAKFLSFEDGLSMSNRGLIQDQVSSLLDKKFSTLVNKLVSSGVSVKELQSIDQFDNEDLERVSKCIIESAKERNIQPVDGLFDVTTLANRKLRKNSIFSMMAHMYEEPKPEISYSIAAYSKDMTAIGVEVDSQSINQANGGVIGFFFQGKFGFSIGVLVFNRIWSGLEYSKLGFLSFKMIPFLLNEFNESEVANELDGAINDFEIKLTIWNQQQRKEVDEYKETVKLSKEGS